MTKQAKAAKAVKLNDTQRRILSAGIGDEAKVDRLVPVIEGKGLGKAVGSLVERGLLAAFRPDHTAFMLEYKGQNRSFLVTNAGFEAMNLEVLPAHGDDPSNKAAKAGCMAKNYHDLYMSQGGGCADTIDKAMKDAFLTGSRTITTKGKDGKPDQTRSEAALDLEAMKAWGLKIGLWNDKWDRLNPGMQRMNLTNRVRSQVRKGVKISLKIKQGDRKGTTIELAA